MFWEPGAERQFDAAFRLDRAEPALRPGMTARVVIAGERLAGVQHLPRQVLFEKEGKPVVYVRTAARLHRHAREGRRAAPRAVSWSKASPPTRTWR